MNEQTLKEKTESLVKGFVGDALVKVTAHTFCGLVDVTISWNDGPSIKAVTSWASDNIERMTAISCERNLSFLDDDLTDEEYAAEYNKYWDVSFPWVRADGGEMPVAINPLPVVIKNGQLS